MEFCLRPLSASDGRDIYDMLQGIAGDSNLFTNPVKDMPYADYEKWLEKHEGYSRGEHMPNWMVPETTFWLYCDGVPIGIGRIRHFLNDKLERDGGHIGYAIAEQYRSRGCGYEILRLLLQECKKLKIDIVQLRANMSNTASNKIILRSGGILHKTVENRNIYLIDLRKQYSKFI